MEEVPAFLDVFMLIQLFIWMIKKSPAKSWSRPLDWRWVLYPKEMTEDIILRVRALTAICSDFYTSPKDCSELARLISNLFSHKAMEIPSSSLNEIKNIVEKGRALSIVDYSNDRTAFENSYPLFLTLLEPITLFLHGLKEKAEKEKLPLSFAINSIENFVHTVRQTQRFEKEIMSTVHAVNCGNHPGEIFYVSFRVTFYPALVHKGTEIPDLIPIDLRIYRSSTNHGDTNRAFQLAINSVGEFFYLKHGRHAITREEISSKIENLIFDPEVWAVHKH